jgi:hypothetical protein
MHHLPFNESVVFYLIFFNLSPYLAVRLVKTGFFDIISFKLINKYTAKRRSFDVMTHNEGKNQKKIGDLCASKK